MNSERFVSQKLITKGYQGLGRQGEQKDGYQKFINGYEVLVKQERETVAEDIAQSVTAMTNEDPSQNPNAHVKHWS